MARHKSAGQVAIANGASLSSPISLGEKTLCGIIVPPAWTAAGLSFQASDDGGATWANVFDSTGAEVTIASAGIVAGQRVSIDPKPFAGIDFLKVRSGTGASPVNQGGARALTIISAKVYPLTWLGAAAATGTAPTGPPVFVAHAAAGSLENNTVTTTGINTAGANFAVLALSDYSINSIATISDSYSNTWHPMTSQAAASGVRATLFYASGLTAGAGHTFTATSTGNFPAICVVVFSGVVGSLDAQNGAVGGVSTNTLQPGSVLPTTNGELIVTGLAYNTLGGVSIGSGFTVTDTIPGDSAHTFAASIAYLIQTTAGAVNPTWAFNATASAPAAAIGAFK